MIGDFPNRTSISDDCGSISTRLPATIQPRRIEYVSPCLARSCRQRATTIARKLDKAGRFIRQIGGGEHQLE